MAKDSIFSPYGGLLERSQPLGVLVERLDAALRTGRGAVVLLSGEAGVGKTALARAWRASRPRVRALWGGCEALETPRPLGALIDMAEQAGGALAAVAAGHVSPAAIVLGQTAGDVRTCWVRSAGDVAAPSKKVSHLAGPIVAGRGFCFGSPAGRSGSP